MELEAGWMPVRWEVKIRAINYYIKVSRNEKMKLLNRVMAWANEWLGWMEGEGGLLIGVYGMEWSGFVGRDHRRCVTSSGERHVGGMCMEKASGRVERGMQLSTP